MATDPYASGVLVKEHHDRLVADLDNFARDAGIQSRWIYAPLPDTVTEGERAYLKAFRAHCASGAVAGLCYTKKAKLYLPVDQYMSAIAGCLVRNFVRARVMTLGSVLDHQSAGTMPDLTCLLIPNFFHPVAEGGTIAPWQVSALHDLLVARRVAGQQTIVYAADLNLLAKEYGLALRDVVVDNYRLIGA
jgi:hypothetical protein